MRIYIIILFILAIGSCCHFHVQVELDKNLNDKKYNILRTDTIIYSMGLKVKDIKYVEKRTK
jgi:ABC-type polysaccharide transport system permease subunit